MAAFGALFTSRLTALLGAKADLHITPEVVRGLAPNARETTALAFADAITRVFEFAVPLLLLGFVLACFIKETPLRTSSGDVRRAAILEVDFAEDSLIGLSDPGARGQERRHRSTEQGRDRQRTGIAMQLSV